jgi:hypothetical protein
LNPVDTDELTAAFARMNGICKMETADAPALRNFRREIAMATSLYP